MGKYKSRYMEGYLNKPERGEKYDKIIENKFELFVWDLEKYFLEKIYFDFLKNNENIQYLDFACGTGRIISYFKNDLGLKNALGVDTSSSMLDEARKKTDADFLCGNIVENQSLLGDKKFDLITSFRLFLNMEKENRSIILKELYRYLKNDGYLVVNNHVNRFSLIGIQFWIRKHLLGGKRKLINTATEREFCSLLDNSGLEAIEVYKFALFPGRKSIILLPGKMLFKLELFLSKVPFIRNFGLNQIYICQKKK